MKNYYEILQVPDGADYEKIDEAYWRLARESTAPSDETQYTIDDLNEVYELLRTPLLRQGYDASRTGKLNGKAPKSHRAPKTGDAPAPSGAGDPSADAPAIEGPFAHALQLQVREARERMRAHNAAIEVAADQHAQSPLQRMFARLR